MKTAQHKPVGHPMTPILGVGIGAAICLLLTIILSAITAWFVSSEHLPQSAIGVAAIPIVCVATFIGCLVALLLTDNMPAVVAGACAGCHFAILLCTNILFMNSSLGGAGKGFAGILGGAAIAVVIRNSSRKQNKRKKHRTHR